MNWAVVVYRGAVKLDLKSSVPGISEGTQIDLPGFTKRGDCKRVIVLGNDNAAGAGAIPTPAGFTVRGETAAAPRFIVADAPPANYVNDATVTLTDIDPASTDNGSLCELY